MKLQSKSNIKTTVLVEDDNGAEMKLDITFDYEAGQAETPTDPGIEPNICEIEAMHRGWDHYNADYSEQVDAACWEKVELMQSKLEAMQEDYGMGM
jgi:hypothetical protein